MDVRTDGNGARRDEVPRADRPSEVENGRPDAASIDERLAAIVEVIRSWDWRSSDVVEAAAPERPPSEGRHAARHASGPLAACPEVPRRRPTTPKHVAEDRRPFGAKPFLAPAGVPADRPVRSLAGEPAPRQAPPKPIDAGPPPAEAMTHVAFDAPREVRPPRIVAPPMTAPTHAAEPVGAAMRIPNLAPPPTRAPSVDPAIAPAARDSGRTRSPQRWHRVALWAVAAAVVVTVVAVIRMNAPGATSGSLTPTTVPSKSSAAPAALIPVSRSVKSAFVAASASLNAANDTVTQALASSSGQSVAQITQELNPYATALNTFLVKLHLVTWPETMQVPSEDLTLRTQALATFISTISSVNATTLGAWVSQFHALASSTETAANLIRRDIGLRNTSSYP
jgi:hypothetical protein